MKTLLAATMLLSLLDPLLAQTAQGGSATPLIVHAQGSFAVGGTVIRNAGTFDQLRPGPEGQTYTVTTPMCSTRCRSTLADCR